MAKSRPADRIVIVGCSGVGKSTLARHLSHRLNLPHLELDSVFHQANWTQLTEDDFRARVEDYLKTHPAWIIDGNYAPVRALVWAQATDVVWLHPPRWRVMRRIITRTIRRTLTREELWNGNREPWANLFSLNPERSMIAWSYTRHSHIQETMTQWQADPQWSHARHHKFVTNSQTQRWLESLSG